MHGKNEARERKKKVRAKREQSEIASGEPSPLKTGLSARVQAQLLGKTGDGEFSRVWKCTKKKKEDSQGRKRTVAFIDKEHPGTKGDTDQGGKGPKSDSVRILLFRSG